ncbi:MAG TPA: hypothetical protein DGG94_14235 [Micromonosporaceae bacterium]|nr:hypothetical protein [Micromonosporaceae bacterium]HCU50934.1 hypothetical protein [Micromonosporaceae bacterium]
MSYSDSSNVASPAGSRAEVEAEHARSSIGSSPHLACGQPRRPGKHRLIPVAPAVATTVASPGRATDWLRDPVIAAFDIGSTGP